jgi:hypothetical protein
MSQKPSLRMQGMRKARKQVLPAVPNLTVDVSQDVIDESIQKDSAHCMISQALRLAGAASTKVTAEHASFNFNGHRYTYPLPAKAAAELVQFDEDKNKVKPFKFTLSSNVGFVRSVYKRPDAAARGPTRKKRAKSKGRKITRSTRRYHGLAVIKDAT